MTHPLTRADLLKWRSQVARDVQDAEYELAKWRAMLAWLDREIDKVEAE